MRWIMRRHPASSRQKLIEAQLTARRANKKPQGPHRCCVCPSIGTWELCLVKTAHVPIRTETQDTVSSRCQRHFRGFAGAVQRFRIRPDESYR
jgi:hypothetical protein